MARKVSAVVFMGLAVVLFFGPRNSACTDFLMGDGPECIYSPRPYWVLVVGLAVAGLLWWSSERKKTNAESLPD
jgi:hypothetical protein